MPSRNQVHDELCNNLIKFELRPIKNSNLSYVKSSQALCDEYLPKILFLRIHINDCRLRERTRIKIKISDLDKISKYLHGR